MHVFATADGGSIVFTDLAYGVDVHTRNASGETISSVILRKDEADMLIGSLLTRK